MFFKVGTIILDFINLLNLLVVGKGEIMFVVLFLVFSLAFHFFDGAFLIQIVVLLDRSEEVEDFTRLLLWDREKFSGFRGSTGSRGNKKRFLG